MSYLDSAESRERMQEANAEDQRVYDFVTSTIYPRQLAAYGEKLDVELRQFHQRNRTANRLTEPFIGSFLRNFVYKPLLHIHVI